MVISHTQVWRGVGTALDRIAEGVEGCAATSGWEIFVAIFQALAVLIMMATAVFIYSQVRVARKAMQGAGWLDAHRLFNQPDPLGFRGKVMAIERPVEADEWGNRENPDKVTTKDGKRTVERDEALNTCRLMDHIGALGVEGALPKKVVLREWGDPFRKTWIVLKLLVNKERSSVDWDRKWRGFEYFGEKAVKEMRWPKHWDRPSDCLLEKLGWKWKKVGCKGGKPTKSKADERPTQTVECDK